MAFSSSIITGQTKIFNKEQLSEFKGALVRIHDKGAVNNLAPKSDYLDILNSVKDIIVASLFDGTKDRDKAAGYMSNLFSGANSINNSIFCKTKTMSFVNIIMH